MNRRPLILYHGHCMDGLGAAFAAWIRFGEDAEYQPCMYGKPAPDVERGRGRDVYLFDFTFTRAEMDAFNEVASSFVVLDHHVHAAPLLEGTTYGHFDNTKSGAVLAWEHFFPIDPLPRMFRYLQDRDLWTRELPDHEEITQAIRQHSGKYDDPRTLNAVFHRLEREPEMVAQEARVLVAQIARFIRNDLTRAYVRQIADLPIVFCTSTPNYVSDLAGEMLVAFPEARASCVMFRNDDGTWLHSLRSRQGSDVDVGAVAKRYGGGGHKHSAGFPHERMLEDIWES
jgi:oligoribonuclease NrnB/cAMP/cGMP phosphodiesterase (DHH superfamily)